MHAPTRRTCSIAAAILLSIASMTTATAAQADEVAHLDAPPPAGGEGGGGTTPWYITAVCGNENFKDRNPSDCHSDYTVYDVRGDRPTVLLYLQGPGQDAWAAIAQGYQAAQDWCASNSLTCSVVTSIGVSVALGWLGPTNG
jgi:hypothetical protein